MEREGSLTRSQQPDLDPILSPMNPAILHTTSFLQTHFNITLPCTLYLSDLFPFTVPDYCFLSVSHIFQ